MPPYRSPVEKEPPPITVVDPSRGTDVLVMEPEQTSRRVVLVGLVVALLGGTAVVADTLRDDRVADRAALAAVRLLTEAPPDTGIVPAGTVRIAVRNVGPEAVRLLSARLVAPGYGEVRVDKRVPAGAAVTIGLRDTATCGPTMLATPAESVTVRLRTARGSTVTRSLPLSPTAFKEVNHAARARCGYLGAGEAFSFQATSLSDEGKTVLVAAQVVNRSLLPLTLYRFDPTPGLRISLSPSLPIDLPVQTRPDGREGSVPVVLRLQVTDCADFLRSLGYPNLGGAEDVVRGYVMRDATAYEVPVLRVDPTRSFLPRVDTSNVLTRLLRTCPTIVID